MGVGLPLVNDVAEVYQSVFPANNVLKYASFNLELYSCVLCNASEMLER